MLNDPFHRMITGSLDINFRQSARRVFVTKTPPLAPSFQKGGRGGVPSETQLRPPILYPLVTLKRGWMRYHSCDMTVFKDILLQQDTSTNIYRGARKLLITIAHNYCHSGTVSLNHNCYYIVISWSSGISQLFNSICFFSLYDCGSHSILLKQLRSYLKSFYSFLRKLSSYHLNFSTNQAACARLFAEAEHSIP